MRPNLILIGLVLFLTSCNPFELKPLDVQTIKKNDITIRWFKTSDITTIHNHVQINTGTGWVDVMETDGNEYKIYDILIDKDTIIVQGYKGMFLYKLIPEYSGKSIRFDSSITLFDYMTKFDPVNAKYYKNIN